MYRHQLLDSIVVRLNQFIFGGVGGRAAWETLTFNLGNQAGATVARDRRSKPARI